MNRKLALTVTVGFVLIGILIPSTVSAEILVGVKSGDRMEYDVEYYAVSEPPAGPVLIRREIEVLNVQGTNVTFDLTEKASDGTEETDTFTEDLETGVLDAFIIPANLSNGDLFNHDDYGFIIISGVGEKSYAGANRTVVYANVSNMDYIWDKSTGVLVDLWFLNEYLQAWMRVKMVQTNIWQAEFLLPIDPTILMVAVVIIVAALFLVIRRRKMSKGKKRESKKKKRKK